ncbi:MAG: tRNA guanosine(34) transglycosylase Tgt, partial [Oricola sp.]
MTPFSFSLLNTDGAARRGVVHTARGDIRTPAFMPVGTVGTVKAMYLDQVRGSGADIILGNTYHLMLRPGAERVARLGGLHEFIRWPHPILTDSGGFQVMSLSALRKMSEDGVVFQSHIDGQRYEMSPERSIEIQGLLGSDIQMQLDECVALPATPDVMRKAMELSLRWAERCKTAFGDQPEKAMFGIVQGGDDQGLRAASAMALAALDLKGYAVGGLAVGEPQDVMLAILDATCPLLPAQKPRYLMGVGTPQDSLRSVGRGIDMFDCVMPTRSGRH